MDQHFSVQDVSVFCVLSDMAERKKYFLMLKKELPQIQKFPAIMGKSLEKKDLEYLMRKKILNVRSICFLKEGEIGIYLSNLQILNNFIKSKKEYCIILEDDMCLKNNFESDLREALLECPLDWDILYLYLNPFQKNILLTPIKNKKHILKASPIWGTCAYMVNQKGARKITANIQPMKYALDSHFGKLIHNNLLEAFVIKKEISINSGSLYRGHSNKIPSLIEGSKYLNNFFWWQKLLRFFYFFYFFIFLLPVWFIISKWASEIRWYGFITYSSTMKNIKSLKLFIKYCVVFVKNQFRKWMSTLKEGLNRKGL